MEVNDLPALTRALAASVITTMQAGKRMEILYNNEPRVVEIHAVGLSSKGKPCMRVYQVVGGATFSGETSGWKMLSLDKIESFRVLDEASEGPRPGYNPNDAGMGTIFAEISNEPVPSEQAP